MYLVCPWKQGVMKKNLLSVFISGCFRVNTHGMKDLEGFQQYLIMSNGVESSGCIQSDLMTLLSSAHVMTCSE